jgi:phage terminase Nu1 subunit (DNA packaging protein)
MKKCRDQAATSREIQRRLEVTDRTVGRWVASGLPCKRDAKNSPVVKLWDLLEYLYKGRLAESDGDSPALERYRLAKAEEAERRNAVEEGKLLKADDVKRQLRALAHALRTQLEAIVRVRPEVEPEIRAALAGAAKQIEKEFQVDGEDAGGVTS